MVIDVVVYTSNFGDGMLDILYGCFEKLNIIVIFVKNLILFGVGFFSLLFFKFGFYRVVVDSIVLVLILFISYIGVWES